MALPISRCGDQTSKSLVDVRGHTAGKQLQLSGGTKASVLYLWPSNLITCPLQGAAWRGWGSLMRSEVGLRDRWCSHIHQSMDSLGQALTMTRQWGSPLHSILSAS